MKLHPALSRKASSTSQSTLVRRSLSTRRLLANTFRSIPATAGQRLVGEGGFLTPRVLVALVLCAAAGSILTGTALAFFRSSAPSQLSQRTLSFAERVSYQRAIEDVYWRHRIWPKENPNPKPSLDGVMSQAQLERKVTDSLRNFQALEDYYHHSVTAEDLQAEMDRMAENTKQP